MYVAFLLPHIYMYTGIHCCLQYENLGGGGGVGTCLYILNGPFTHLHSAVGLSTLYYLMYENYPERGCIVVIESKGRWKV